MANFYDKVGFEVPEEERISHRIVVSNGPFGEIQVEKPEKISIQGSPNENRYSGSPNSHSKSNSSRRRKKMNRSHKSSDESADRYAVSSASRLGH
jgi:hypothetical protein